MTALYHQFTIEKFHSINQPPTIKNIFAAELLYKTPSNNTEAFFKAARENPNTIVPTDLEIFKSAIYKHLDLEYPVSINLNVETYFDDRLIETIKNLKKENPQLDYTQICLEITEQGKIPDIFDDRKLTALIDMGFTLALDDFDPRQKSEWKRLKVLEDFIAIVKFPHEIMTDLRGPQKSHTSKTIDEIRIRIPDKILIMEGVRKTDAHHLDLLKSLGIDIIQESRYTAQGSNPLALAI